MVYKVIGLMSGSSLDGVDIAYVELQEQQVTSKQGSRGWGYSILQAATRPYTPEWKRRLAGATGLSARDYVLLHAEYGRYLGEEVKAFIGEAGLDFRVQLIASHGHTVFHEPARGLEAQVGNGAVIAAVTGINVVSDLRSMDVALGGQGAPVVPIGERLLLPEYAYFLNLGGIANVSSGASDGGAGAPATHRVGFDVCPANRVLNVLAADLGLEYDADGAVAATGLVDTGLLERLNALPYYAEPWPKSLANEFGTEVVLPMIRQAGLGTADALRTYVEHVAVQVGRAVALLGGEGRILVTGGGAHNGFLVARLRERLDGVDVEVPDAMLVDYKEALVMALMGVLRWREENNVLASVTGASRDSINGAVWIGQEA
jgi:anhydro-N-acetylmuramic acid kinase